MTIQNPSIGSIQNGPSSTGQARTVRGTLDQDAFLQILVSKLRNQDPMAPMEDQDFIAQMAQFSALEQMQALNASFGFAQAAGLVGKTVQATFFDTAGIRQTVSGIVTRARVLDNVPCLTVAGQEVPYNDSLVVLADRVAAEPSGPEAAGLP